MSDTKQCRKCGQVKSLSDFSREAAQKDGHRATCKECRKAVRSDAPSVPHAKRDERRAALAKHYGVSTETYVAWIGQPCEVCGAEPRDGHSNGVYASKTTGAPMAVVCQRCASALGYLGHSQENVARALDVLKRSEKLK